jgi:hypothetical protein
MQKTVEGLSTALLFGLYIFPLYKGAIVFSEHNREQWEKRKKYKSAYVFSIAKLDSGQRGCSQTSQDVLSKMQNSSSSHSQPLQGWKTQSPSQRRTPSQTRKKRLRRTEISASTRIRQNNQKTNPTAQMQKMRLHAPQRRHTPTKTNHRITRRQTHDRMEQTHPKTQKPIPTSKMPKMRKRTTHLQQRRKQSNLQRLQRNTRRTNRRQSKNKR